MKKQLIFLIIFLLSSTAFALYQFRGPLQNIKLNDWTALRLLATNDVNEAISTNLIDWTSGIANEIDIVSNGSGGILIGIIDPLAVSKGGTGQETYTNGQLLIGNTTGNTLTKAALTGTVNQINVVNGAGSITLSTPQDINTVSSPQFARLYLDGTNTYLDRDGSNNMTLTDAVTGTKTLAELAAGTTGVALYSFKTITGITNNVVADSNEDTLTLASANARLTIVGTTATDTITWTVDTNLHNYSWTDVNATDLKTGSVTQAYDADLADLADGTLSKSKVQDSTNWDTAYGWGDHAGLYLDIDHDACDVTSAKIANWDASYVLKTTLDAINGYIRGNGGGVYWADANAYSLSGHIHAYQPIDDQLNDIAGLGVAKGSILVGSATHWELLAVGNDDEVLTADSGEPNGVKWAAASGGDMTKAVYDTDNNGLVDSVDDPLTLSSLVINDDGTIGQAAGPLLTFDDTANKLSLSGGLFSGASTVTATALVQNQNVLTVDTTGGDIAWGIGIWGETDVSGGNDITSFIRGIYGKSKHIGTGTVADARGVQGAITCEAAGVITNAYTLSALGPVTSGGGAITTAYGLYISVHKAAGVTTGYGIYQVGADDLNYFAGASDFGAAPSLEIPNSAAPTVDAEGELAWESDDDELHICFAAGANDTVIASKTKSRSFVIKGITSSDDMAFWQTPRALTITKVAAICSGGTNVVCNLQEYSGTATAPVDVNTGDWTITTTEYETTSFTNPTIDAGDYLGFKTTSVSGIVNFFTLTFYYYEQ